MNRPKYPGTIYFEHGGPGERALAVCRRPGEPKLIDIHLDDGRDYAMVCLTPYEARKLARALLRAAQEIEPGDL